MAGEREALRELQRQINEGPSPETMARINEALTEMRKQTEAAFANFNLRNIKWPIPNPAPVSRQTETTEG